jgi:hypothetical protein
MRTSPRRFRKYIAEAATGMSDPLDRVRNQNTKTPIRWAVNEGWVGRQIWRTDGVGNGRALGCEGQRRTKSFRSQSCSLQSAHSVLVCISREARLAARAVQMKISAKELVACGPGRKICVLSRFLKYFWGKN